MRYGVSLATVVAALLLACQSKPQISPPENPDTAPVTVQPDTGGVQEAAPAAAPDPIGKVEAYISGNLLWTNGLFPRLDLPASATPEEVLTAFLAKASFDKGKVTSPRIVATRAIGGSSSGTRPYTAVYFESEQGNRVVLMRYEGNDTGWWTRALDPEALGP